MSEQQGIDEAGVDGVTLDPKHLEAEFAYFRGAFHGTKDSLVEKYVAAARAAKIPWGLYQFPDQHGDITAQWAAFKAISDALHGDDDEGLPDTYDLERLDEVRAKDGTLLKGGVTPAVAVENARKWGQNHLDDRGHRAILYWSYRVWLEVLLKADCSVLYPLFDSWEAHTGHPSPPPWEGPTMVQWAFDKKGTPGVSGDGHADRDVYYVLGPGSKGRRVVDVQTMLKIFPDACPTGVYGDATEAAVKAYQASKGLAATGLVDVRTAAKLHHEGR